MKKIFIFILITITVTACSLDVKDYVVDYSDRIAVYPPTIGFVESVDTSYIDVASNHNDWTVSSNTYWCKVEKIDSRVRVTVQEKDLVEPTREATITISSSNGVVIRYVSVSQINSETGPLVGSWTVTEDFYAGSWNNGQTYTITMAVDAVDKTKVWITGLLPYGSDVASVFYATVKDGKITIPCQAFQQGAGWDEPDYRTYIAPLKNSTLSANAGLNFDPLSLEEDNGKPMIKILGGFSTYSFFIYDIEISSAEYAGYWGYCRNTVWIKD